MAALPLLVAVCTAPHAYGQTDERPFVMTWTVNAGGWVKIPVDDENGTYGATGEYTIDWGDGTVETISGTAEHRYSNAGNYAISITGNFTKIYLHGSIPNGSMSIEEWMGSTSTSVWGVGSTPSGLLSIDQWGDVKWTSMAYAFSGARNMVYNATDVPDLSSVTDMSHMFYFAKKFNGDLSAWNVSGVTDMSHMFYQTTAFNGNLSAWNVSGVTDMSHMFYESDTFNQDISAWDVSSVTDTSWMFSRAFNFNQDISSWNVSSVTDMSRMFANSIDFNQDISSWDVSHVTDMHHMFYGSYSFNHDISSWDVSHVTDMSHMFQFAYKFNRNISAWDVSSVTDMNNMFKYAETFNGDISAWNVSGVTDMNHMFQFAYKFNGDISAWNVSGVTDMNRMFQSAYKFNGDISAWDVSGVTDMNNMFNSASAFKQNLGRWYIVPEDMSIVDGDSSLVVTTISAQNAPLGSQNPVYAIGVGHDSSAFEMDHNALKLKATPAQSVKSAYTVSVTATGAFGTNNHRFINITVAEYVPDTTPPYVSMIWRDSPNNAITNGATMQFGIMFSEDVQNVDVTDFVLTGTSNASITHVSGSRDEYGVIVSATTDGTATLALATDNDIKDMEDNGLIDPIPTAGTDHTYTVDTTAPTVTSIERYSPDAGNTDSQALVYKVTFSENVTGVNAGDFALSTDSTGAGSITSLAGSGDTYRVTVSAIQDGTYNLDLVSSGHGIVDAASNPLDDTSPAGEDQSYTVTVPSTLPNSMPSVDAGSDQTVQENSAVTLNGTASDADADPLTYLWSHDSDLAITLSDAASLSTSFTAPQVDSDTTITFTLTVHDGTSNATDTTGVTITDTTPPVVPVAPRDIGSVTLASTVSGVVEASWEAPAEEPRDYRIAWAKVGEGFRTWTDLTVNAFPVNSSHTITDLEEGAEYKVMVRARYDGGSGDWSDQYTVAVKASEQDTTAPTVVSITRSDPTVEVTNRTSLVFQVAFSEDVTGVNAGDFALSTDSTGAGSIAGLAGSGDTYRVTVSAIQDGTYNLDLVSSGHGIADAASNPLTSTAPTTGTDEAYTVSTMPVDTTAPTILSIERYSPTDQNTDSQTLVYRVTFSENVTGVDLSDFALSPGSTGAGGASGQLAQTSEPATRIADRSTIQDAITVGPSGTATSVSVAVDISHTYIGDLVIDLIAPDGTARTLHSRTGGSANDIDRTYTPDFGGTGIAGDWTLRVSDRAGGDVGTLNGWTLTIGHGGADSPVTGLAGSGSRYLVNVSAAQDGTYNLDLASSGHGIADAADNPLSSPTPTGADHTYTVSAIPADTTAPTVTSIERSDPAEATTSERTLVFAVTFSEDVTGVDQADFVLSSDSTGTGSIANLAGSGSRYLVTVAAAQDGTYNLDLASSGHGIADAADNPLSSPAPTGADHTYTVSAIPADTTAPTVTSIERSDPAEATTSERTLVFAVTFSENVTGVDLSDFALSPGSTGAGGASGQLAQTSEPATRIADRSTIQDAITVNQSGTATSVSVAVDISHTYIGDLVIDLIAPDGTARTLHSRTGGSANDIDRTYTPDFGGTGIAGDWTLRVSDRAGGDVGTLNGWTLTVNHGGAGSPVTGLAGSGSRYLVSVSAAQDGTYNLDLASSGHGIADAADNPLSSPTPTGADHTYTVSATPADATAPTVTSIERSNPAEATTSERTLVFAVTFSENVTGVDLSDFALSPGSTGAGGASGQLAQTSEPATRIADRSTIQDAITVNQSGTATSVSVAVDISHTYIGDLVIDLIAPDGTARTLHSRTGSSANDIDRTYTPDFGGTGIAGDWTLRVSDRAGGDVGTLNGWTLTIGHGGADSPVTGLAGSGSRYLVTVAAAQDGTYNLDLASSGHGIADAADNPLSSPTPTGADHTYTVRTSTI